MLNIIYFMLRCTAAHCSTLQHAATQYSTLQHVDAVQEEDILYHCIL